MLKAEMINRGKSIYYKDKPERTLSLEGCILFGVDEFSNSLAPFLATRLFEMDVPIKTVQTLLGHVDVNTTMNIYTHVMQDKKLEVLDLLNKL